MKLNRHSASGLLLTTAMAIACGTASPARAQSDPAAATDDQTASTPKAASPDGQGVEDIVVTAERRSANIQDVPIAISAVTGSKLATLNVTGTIDLGQVIPGLTQNLKALNAQPYLRGMGVGSAQAGLESSVATYIDDVYMASAVSTSFSLNSIDRIEVLKGPQGTLFGRNASAGVVSVFTKDPGPNSSVAADVSYENYNRIIGRFYGDAGLSDTLAANVSVYYEDQPDGWGTNLFNGTPKGHDQSLDLRSKLLWNPSSSTEIRLAGWYTHMWSDKGVNLPRHSLLSGAYVCTACGPYDANSNLLQFGRADTYGGSLKFTQGFGGFKIVDILAYQKVDPYFILDTDISPSNRAGLANTALIQASPESAWTNELQLVSTTSGPFSWVAGFFYYNGTSTFNQQSVSNFSVNPPAGSRTRSELDSKSYAPFVQATYEVMPGTRITGGVRYSIDDRHALGSTFNLATGAQTNATTRQKEFSKFTYRASIAQDFSPDIMGYVSIDRGYKAGLFNVAEITGPAVGAEVLDSYEAGLKTELFDHHVRLNTAFFYYTVNGLQLKSLIPGTAITVIQNAANARAYGADVDFDVVVSSRFKLSGGFELIDGIYTNFPGAVLSTPKPPAQGGNSTFFGDASGARLVFTPVFQGNLGAFYDLPLGDSGKISVAANFHYQTRMYWEPDERLSQEPYGLLSGSVTWTSRDDRWLVSVYGANLTNKYYLVNAGVANATGDLGYPGAPRTYGVRVGLKFGK